MFGFYGNTPEVTRPDSRLVTVVRSDAFGSQTRFTALVKTGHLLGTAKGGAINGGEHDGCRWEPFR